MYSGLECSLLPLLFNKNRSCIEIWWIISKIEASSCLIRTEVVLKLLLRTNFLESQKRLIRTEVVLKYTGANKLQGFAV